MCFIPGFFLVLSLEVSGIFGAEFVHQTLSMANPTKMLERAENAASHGDYDTAIRIYRQLTPEYQKKFGPEHPTTLKLLVQLDLVYFKAEKYSDALPTAWKLYKINKKLHGEENTDTIKFLSGLGKIYYKIGKHEKAEQLWKRAYRLLKSKFGQNHRKTMAILFHLAHVYRVLGESESDYDKSDLAIRYYQKIYDVNSKGRAPNPEMPLGEDYELGLEALMLAGMVLGWQEKFKEATQVFQNLLDQSVKTLGVDHPLTQHFKKALVQTLSRDGKTGQANEILRTVDPGKEEHDVAFHTLVDAKAEALEKQGKLEKAIEILAEYYEHEMLKRQVLVDILSILHKLIKYSRQQGDYEQVIKWANAVIDLVQNKGQKVKVITEENRRKMILLRLYALDSLIYVYSERNDEDKVDEWFEIARSSVELIRGQGQGQGQGHLMLSTKILFEIFLEIQYHVADFKERIGKTDEAIPLYLNFAKNTNDDKERAEINNKIERLQKTQKKKTDQIPNIPEVKSEQSKHKTEKSEL